MPKVHRVRSGDCVSSIAFANGLFWETIWNDPANASLKDERGDPNVLREGDEVTVPDLRIVDVSAGTEQVHRFRLKGVPAQLQLRVMRPRQTTTAAAKPAAAESSSSGSLFGDIGGPIGDALNAAASFLGLGGANEKVSEDPVQEPFTVEEEPRSEVPFVLSIDGRIHQGTTDADGWVRVSIPPDAREGELTVEPGTPDEFRLPLRLGALNPSDSVSGVKQRLANLGFGCGETGEEVTPEFGAALRAFQETYGLDVTGELDDATRQRIRDAHQT